MKDRPEAVAEKLGSGQSLRGIGLFGRIGYAPQETNPITRDASVALFANGLSDHRPNDSCGLGIYHNGISQPLKNDFKQAHRGRSHCQEREWTRGLLRLRDHSGNQADSKLSAHLEPYDRWGGEE